VGPLPVRCQVTALVNNKVHGRRGVYNNATYYSVSLSVSLYLPSRVLHTPRSVESNEKYPD
jgi:hypothetical protein